MNNESCWNGHSRNEQTEHHRRPNTVCVRSAMTAVSADLKLRNIQPGRAPYVVLLSDCLIHIYTATWD